MPAPKHDRVIDVRAAALRDNVDGTGRGRKRQKTWKDRDEALERVPPKGVQAWGAWRGGRGGIDVRMQATLVAVEEIQRMEGSLRIKEEVVVDAEEEVILLKL